MSDESSRRGNTTDEGTVPGGNGPTEIPDDSPASESDVSLDKQAEELHRKHQE
jgi:hypothetical protein